MSATESASRALVSAIATCSFLELAANANRSKKKAHLLNRVLPIVLDNKVAAHKSIVDALGVEAKPLSSPGTHTTDLKKIVLLGDAKALEFAASEWCAGYVRVFVALFVNCKAIELVIICHSQHLAGAAKPPVRVTWRRRVWHNISGRGAQRSPSLPHVSDRHQQALRRDTQGRHV